MSSIIKFNNNVLGFNSKVLKWSNYNPLNLPPYTIRIKLNDGYVPSSFSGKGTYTQVSETPNIWDCTYINDDWTNLLISSNAKFILGANSTNVTSMDHLVYDTRLSGTEIFDTSNVINANAIFARTNISSVPEFDFHNVQNANGMFFDCIKLSAIPYLNFSSVKSAGDMFYQCNHITSYPDFYLPNLENAYRMFRENYDLKVLPNITVSDKLVNVSNMFAYTKNASAGILRTYSQLSALTSITAYTWCYKDCGTANNYGRAELAQIPSAWK